jgi:sulfate permease, SulP family
LEAARGVVVYRFDAPLFFASADYFVDQAIELLDRADLERFVLDFEAVTLVDVTAARALKQFLSTVKSCDAELSVARASRAVHHQIDEAGLVEAIGESRFTLLSGRPFAGTCAAGAHGDLRWATQV